MRVTIGDGGRRSTGASAGQVHTLAFAVRQLATEVRGKLGQLLAEPTPGDRGTFFLTPDGAEANDAAAHDESPQGATKCPKEAP